MSFVLRKIHTRQVLLAGYLNATFDLMSDHLDHILVQDLIKIIAKLQKDSRISAQIITTYGFGTISKRLCKYRKKMRTRSDSQRIHSVEKIFSHTHEFIQTSLNELNDFRLPANELEVETITSCCFETTIKQARDSKIGKRNKNKKTGKKGHKNSKKRKQRRGKGKKKQRKNKKKENKTKLLANKGS